VGTALRVFSAATGTVADAASSSSGEECGPPAVLNAKVSGVVSDGYLHLTGFKLSSMPHHCKHATELQHHAVCWYRAPQQGLKGLRIMAFHRAVLLWMPPQHYTPMCIALKVH
jgi:hypothetical protein